MDRSTLSLPTPAAVRLAGLALLLRVLFLAERAATTGERLPVLDEAWYLAVARALVAGDIGTVAAIDPGFRSLLYPSILAAFLSAVGEAALPFAVSLLQHFLGIATILLVADLAVRWTGRVHPGLVAGGLLILAGPPLHFESQLLVTTLFTFLVTLTIWLPVRVPDARGILGAAVVVAVAVQARPNALLLVFALAVPLFLVVPRRRRLATAASSLAVIVGLTLLAGFIQRPLWGVDVWLPTAGGVNLYLGNERGADGRQPRQDFAVAWGDVHRDSVQLFAAAGAREGLGKSAPTPTEIDRYWRRRAVEEIAADPPRWLGLVARKTTALVSNREVPNNRTWDFVRSESRVLRLLPVSWALLLGFAGLGIAVLHHRGGLRSWAWPIAAGAVLAAGVLAFFVAARYRIPLWPLLAALAGVGLAGVPALLRSPPGARGRTALLLPILLTGASLGLDATTPPENVARDHLYRSIARLEAGETLAALEDARRAVELAPDDPAAWLQLGTVELALGRYPDAGATLTEALRLRSDEPRILTNLGVALEHSDRPGPAYRLYRKAEALGTGSRAPLVNAALLELRAGLVERARLHLDRTRTGERESSSPDDVPWLVASSRLAFLSGHHEESGVLYRRASRLDSERADRLRKLLTRPIPPEMLGWTAPGDEPPTTE